MVNSVWRGPRTITPPPSRNGEGQPIGNRERLKRIEGLEKVERLVKVERMARIKRMVRMGWVDSVKIIEILGWRGQRRVNDERLREGAEKVPIVSTILCQVRGMALIP